MTRTVLALAALTVAFGSAALAASPSAATDNTHSPTTELSSNGLSDPFGGVAGAVPVLPSAANPTVPGATGSTFVRGDHSTIAGDRAATRDEQTGGGLAGGGG